MHEDGVGKSTFSCPVTADQTSHRALLRCEEWTGPGEEGNKRQVLTTPRDLTFIAEWLVGTLEIQSSSVNLEDTAITAGDSLQLEIFI